MHVSQEFPLPQARTYTWYVPHRRMSKIYDRDHWVLRYGWYKLRTASRRLTIRATSFRGGRRRASSAPNGTPLP